MTKSQKYHAHDENSTAKMGDLVEIKGPPSPVQDKVWAVSKVIEKA